MKQKRQEGEEVSVIENYKIGHFSKKKNKMVNEKADEIVRYFILYFFNLSTVGILCW